MKYVPMLSQPTKIRYDIYVNGELSKQTFDPIEANNSGGFIRSVRCAVDYRIPVEFQ